jgi:hypothetical protein
MKPEDMQKLVRSAHVMLEETIADRIVLLLNELLELDYEATVALVFGPHVPCNQAVADHPSVQVCELSEEHQKGERKWGVRVMGLLNGVAGHYPDGYGRVCGIFEVQCPEHGVFKDEKGNPVLLKRTMPGGGVCACGKKLELGKLVRFARVPPEEHGVKPPEEEKLVH